MRLQKDEGISLYKDTNESEWLVKKKNIWLASWKPVGSETRLQVLCDLKFSDN